MQVQIAKRVTSLYNVPQYKERRYIFTEPNTWYAMAVDGVCGLVNPMAGMESFRQLYEADKLTAPITQSIVSTPEFMTSFECMNVFDAQYFYNYYEGREVALLFSAKYSSDTNLEPEYYLRESVIALYLAYKGNIPSPVINAKYPVIEVTGIDSLLGADSEKWRAIAESSLLDDRRTLNWLIINFADEYKKLKGYV